MNSALRTPLPGHSWFRQRVPAVPRAVLLQAVQPREVGPTDAGRQCLCSKSVTGSPRWICSPRPLRFRPSALVPGAAAFELDTLEDPEAFTAPSATSRSPGPPRTPPCRSARSFSRRPRSEPCRWRDNQAGHGAARRAPSPRRQPLPRRKAATARRRPPRVCRPWNDSFKATKRVVLACIKREGAPATGEGPTHGTLRDGP